jgi:anti-anti-sigma factor
VAEFSIDTTPALWIRVTGEVDVSNAEQFAAALEHPVPVVLDCSGMTFIDSTGFAVLISAYKVARKNGLEFRATNLSGAALKSLQLLKLDYLIAGHVENDA